MPFEYYCDPCKQNYRYNDKKFTIRTCPDPLGIKCNEQLSSGTISKYEMNDMTDAVPVVKEPPVIINNYTEIPKPRPTEEVLATYGNLHHTTKGGKTSGTNHMQHWNQAKAQAKREYLVDRKKKGLK